MSLIEKVKDRIDTGMHRLAYEVADYKCGARIFMVIGPALLNGKGPIRIPLRSRLQNICYNLLERLVPRRYMDEAYKSVCNEMEMLSDPL